MPNRIGLFGGTFDPPHLGHLILASEAQTQLELDRPLWILTAELDAWGKARNNTNV